MKRIKIHPGAWIMLCLFFAFQGCHQKDTAVPDQGTFKNPGSSYAVHTWWHWMDNAITKEGITADLEAMKEVGISTATILNVSLFQERNMGVQAVKFNTEEWYEMFRWALEEAARLGLHIGVHNCDGWSTSGGPWITPELSMKQVVWTRTYLEGGQEISLELRRPLARQDYYEDIAVLAYPATQVPNTFSNSSPEFLADGRDIGKILCDGDPFSMLNLDAKTGIDLSFPEALAFSRISIHPRKDFQWRPLEGIKLKMILQAKMGSGYQTIAEFDSPPVNQTTVYSFPEIKAEEYRIILDKYNDNEPFQPFGISELELLKDGEQPSYFTRIPFHLQKTAITKAEPQQTLFDPGKPETGVEASGVLDLTDKMDEQGMFRWDAPEGSWIILRMGYTTTGKENGPSTIAGRGLECDKMDTAALDFHFSQFPEKLAETAAEFTGNTFEYLFVDSWECNFQNWTRRFPQEFESRRGYSILPWLPVLSGEVIGSSELTERFLQDFRMTIAELVEHNYYQHFNTLCHRLGVDSHAEVIYGGTGYPPLDVLRSNRYVDVPMFEFWAGFDENGLVRYTPVTRPGSDLPMQAATLYGKQVVPAEAYTGFANYSESPWDLKPFGDRAFCSGVNQMVLHSYVHQPDGRKPGFTLGQYGQTFNRHNPWWKYTDQWFSYHSRIQYLLQNSTTRADILCFVGDRGYDLWSPDFDQKLPDGFVIQKCNADILEHHAKVKNGRIELDNGIPYQFLLLPEDDGMELKTLQAIAKLVQDGAIVSGPRPTHTLSLENASRNDQDMKILVDALWGPLNNSGVYVQRFGKGTVYGGISLDELIAKEEFAPGFSTGINNTVPLLSIRKNFGTSEAWFLVNQEDTEVTRNCIFQTEASAPQVWDPMTGECYNTGNFTCDDGSTTLEITLSPRASLFVLFGLPPNEDLPMFERTIQKMTPELSGTISFEELKEKKSIELKGLKSYIEFDDAEIKYYSGKATYHLTFDLPDSLAGKETLTLRLGKVNDGYRLTLNGSPLGNAVFHDFPFKIFSVALAGTNLLEVEVGNGFRNRLIGNLEEGVEDGMLWSTSPVKAYLEGKPLRDGGLVGPVTLSW